jgi:integrase
MLTDTKIKTAKPKDKLYRMADSNGLVIEITQSGIKHWRYRYRFNDKASMVSLGKYPKVSLKTARYLRDEQRDLLDQGLNPSEYRTKKAFQDKVELDRKMNFNDLFYKWFEQNEHTWSENHKKKVMSQCRRHLLKHIGTKSIDDIAAQDILWVFKKIESLGVIETLEKVRGYTGRVFRFAVGLGLLNNDPTRDLPNDIFKKKIVKNFAHITKTEDIGKLLNTIDSFKGSLQVGIALKMAPHVFLRPSELAQMPWSEVDFDKQQIKIPKERMKMACAHIVPLSPQIIDLLKQMHSVSGNSKYVFPSIKDGGKSISPESLRNGLRRLGIDKDTLTTHGLRHMASTQLHEQGFKSDVIERQLSHGERNKIKATYNHAQYLDERREMMNKWSDFLDDLRGNK